MTEELTQLTLEGATVGFVIVVLLCGMWLIMAGIYWGLYFIADLGTKVEKMRDEFWR
jgi:hypothetical protein